MVPAGKATGVVQLTRACRLPHEKVRVRTPASLTRPAANEERGRELCPDTPKQRGLRRQPDERRLGLPDEIGDVNLRAVPERKSHEPRPATAVAGNPGSSHLQGGNDRSLAMRSERRSELGLAL